MHPESALAGVSTAMPALMEAYKLSSRAAHVGFDWPNMDGLFEKLQEETDELRHGLEEFPAPGPRPHSRGIAGRENNKCLKHSGSIWKKKWRPVFRAGEYCPLSFA